MKAALRKLAEAAAKGETLTAKELMQRVDKQTTNLVMVTGSGGAIRNKEEEEKDTASGGAPTHRIRHRHGGPRLARRRGTMAAQFAWFPAIGLNVNEGRLGISHLSQLSVTHVEG